MNTIDDLISFWPSQAELARDIDVPPKHLATMIMRRSIPTRFWTAVINAAARRAIKARRDGDEQLARKFDRVTAENLLKLNDAMTGTKD